MIYIIIKGKFDRKQMFSYVVVVVPLDVGFAALRICFFSSFFPAYFHRVSKLLRILIESL